MRHLAFALVLIVLAAAGIRPVAAYEIEDRVRLGSETATRVLRILSTTDVDQFEPTLRGFLAGHPDVAIDYVVAGSAAVMQAVTAGDEGFDLVISSAMDLQTKLANDGFTLPHSSDATEALPDWARWRQDLFAFTQEPAAIVVSRQALAGLDLPRNRQDLISLMRQHPERFEGRVGTYDLRQ